MQLDAPKSSFGPPLGIQHFLCSHPLFYHFVKCGQESGVSSRGCTSRSFLGCGRENRFSSTKLPLIVLAFSDTLVPIQRRGEPIGPTSSGPVTRTCSLGRECDSQPRSPSPGFRGGSVNGMNRSVCGLRQDRKA